MSHKCCLSPNHRLCHQMLRHICFWKTLSHTAHASFSNFFWFGVVRLVLIRSLTLNLQRPCPTSMRRSILAPPVYLTSTMPLRSLSFLELRRRILLKVGASWSNVNSRILRRCTNLGTATSATRLSKTGCKRSCKPSFQSPLIHTPHLHTKKRYSFEDSRLYKVYKMINKAVLKQV